MSKQIVLFARGNKSVYSTYTAEEKARKVYFALDTNEIIVNDVVFGINLRDLGVDLISSVELTSPTELIFTKTNGKKITINFPLATLSNNGFLSKEDKKKIDEIEDIYATKEELAESTTKIYKYRGSVFNYDGLPSSGQIAGDTYNVEVGFTINGLYYPAGTNVVWVEATETRPGYWDPLGGTDDSYTKEEVDNKFIAWTDKEGGVRIIKLPKDSKLVGTTASNTESDLIKFGIYEDGNTQLTEVGNVSYPVVFNSSVRPTVNLPGGEKQYLAYLQDSGVIDISKYPSGATIEYTFDFTTDYVLENGTPSEVNGERFNADSNSYVEHESYVIIKWLDEAGTKRYSLYSGLIPNTTDAAIKQLRDEMTNYLTWENA